MQEENPAGVYTLSVVRLADPLHAVMGMLNVSAGKQAWTVCGSNGTQSSTTTNSSLGTSGCNPAQPMIVNVSANAEVVMLQPILLVPGVSPFSSPLYLAGGNMWSDQHKASSCGLLSTLLMFQCMAA